MAEEEIDFFKPHPHPTKPRVKSSFFEVVPDAFDDKSLNFTGDHRRLKKKTEDAKQPEPAPEVIQEEVSETPEVPSPETDDTISQHDVCMTSAEPWIAGDHKLHAILLHLSTPKGAQVFNKLLLALPLSCQPACNSMKLKSFYMDERSKAPTFQ